MPKPDVQVVAVDGDRSFREWCALTDRLYASTPQFIPPLKAQLRDFYRQKAPYFAHGDIEFLSIVSDGKVLARTTAHTADRAMGEMMRGLRPVLRARRADQAGHHTIDGDAVLRQIMRQRAGKTDQPGLGGDHMRAMSGAGVRA